MSESRSRYLKIPEETQTGKRVVECGENPFTYDLAYPQTGSMKVKNRTVGHLTDGYGSFVTQRVGMTDKKTGELLPDSSLIMNVKKKVDAEQFVKVYIGGLAAIFDLSTTAQKVLRAALVLYTEGDNFGDELYITLPLAQSKADYPHQKSTWRSGLNELLFREFMCPSSRGAGWYWINPTLFYRGDRLVLINDFQKRGVAGKSPKLVSAKKAADVELDQQDLFTGKTKRDEQGEQDD